MNNRTFDEIYPDGVEIGVIEMNGEAVNALNEIIFETDFKGFSPLPIDECDSIYINIGQKEEPSFKEMLAYDLQHPDASDKYTVWIKTLLKDKFNVIFNGKASIKDIDKVHVDPSFYDKEDTGTPNIPKLLTTTFRKILDSIHEWEVKENNGFYKHTVKFKETIVTCNEDSLKLTKDLLNNIVRVSTTQTIIIADKNTYIYYDRDEGVLNGKFIR